MPKNVKAGPLGFLNIQFAAKYQKNDAEPLVLSGFFCYVKNVIIEMGTLCTNLNAFPLAGLIV